MNLFSSKLRRTATVVGGAVTGLGIIFAMATPALACHPVLTGKPGCVNADGTWTVNWKVYGSDQGRPGTISDVTLTPADSTLTGISVGAGVPATGSDQGPLRGVQTIPASYATASIDVTADFSGGLFASNEHPVVVDKPREACTSQSSTPPTSSPTPSPSVSTSPPPLTEPGFVYEDTCTTLTVGVKVPADWDKPVTVTFTPSTGTAQTVTAKPGETKTVDFPASTGLTVNAVPKDYPDESAKVSYKAPADCTSTASSSSAPGLPVTGSSSAPLAGGAVALLLVGGGAFFLTRRRRMKFTA